MTSSAESAICSACGTTFAESEATEDGTRCMCPSCGSTGRVVSAHAEDTIPFSDKVALKHKRPGYKKPILESVSGMDLHRNTGRMSNLTRVIDRLNNRYTETITDPETGEVLREVDEPLTGHTGRGSAKGRLEPPSDTDA